MLKPVLIKYCLPAGGITLILLTADWLVYRNGATQKYHLFRVMTDNLTHGLVGGWCWAVACLLAGWSGRCNVVETFLCFAMASAVDVDHFIAARSIFLKVCSQPFSEYLERPPRCIHF